MNNKNNDGRRIARVEREVQATVAQYIVQSMRERLPGLVTISQVKMPADLRTAKVFVSVLGSDKERDMVMEILQDRARAIQAYMSEQLQMRYCPKLTFYPDTTTESVLKVERILKELKDERKLEESDDEQ